jgi:predicted aspartyl protease
MGTFLHPITLIGATGERVTVDALVDTGATFTTMPSETLLELGVRPHRIVRLRLADGRSHEQELGHMLVEVDGLEGPTYVLFGSEGAPASIGAITLEGFLLGVDPVAKRLVPVEGWQAMSSPNA